MAQLLYTMFITINHTLFHLWWKVTLVKHQKVSNHYDQDCTIMNIIFKDILILLWYQIFSSRQVKRSVIISNKHSIYELHHELPKDLIEFVSYILYMIVDIIKTILWGYSSIREHISLWFIDPLTLAPINQHHPGFPIGGGQTPDPKWGEHYPGFQMAGGKLLRISNQGGVSHL